MRRRVVLAGLGLVVAGGAVGITAVAADSPTTTDGGADRAGAEDRSAGTTAQVVRTDLADRVELDGDLGFGAPVDLTIGGQGIVTALPEPGAVVERGGTVVEVDGAVVPLFLGTRPLWRTLTADPRDAMGAPTDQLTGPDVRIVEENLQALGFIDADSDAKVDDTYTGSTAEAVKEWQEHLGLPQTGVVEPTDVIVRPAPVRVAERKVEVGAPAGGVIMTVTGVDRRVDIALAANRQGLVTTGDAVEVELPDGSVVGATVSSVGTTITPGDAMQGTSDTVAVVVRLDDPAAAAAYDSAPVTVSVVRSTVTDVLAVPVGALLALSEGGYAVERVQADAADLVAVEIGAFADGLVQVEGDLAEGDVVVVPS